jgi:hypothetical protein
VGCGFSIVPKSNVISAERGVPKQDLDHKVDAAIFTSPLLTTATSKKRTHKPAVVGMGPAFANDWTKLRISCIASLASKASGRASSPVARGAEGRAVLRTWTMTS